MNPLGRAICGEHTSTALLLRRANAPFPEILQTLNHMTLGALCSAITHGNVALVTYLFAQLRKRGEVDCDGEVISSYGLDRRDYFAFSVASFLGQCGDYKCLDLLGIKLPTVVQDMYCPDYAPVFDWRLKTLAISLREALTVLPAETGSTTQG